MGTGGDIVTNRRRMEGGDIVTNRRRGEIAKDNVKNRRRGKYEEKVSLPNSCKVV